MKLELHADPEVLPGLVRKGIGQADPLDVAPRDWQTITIALRGADGDVVAGLYGATMWSWLMIDGLWVAEKMRGQGLGSQLLQAGEGMAIKRRCVGSWLGTFDFQARRFYERHGYAVFATLPGFPPGHTHYHMQKRFTQKS